MRVFAPLTQFRIYSGNFLYIERLEKLIMTSLAFCQHYWSCESLHQPSFTKKTGLIFLFKKEGTTRVIKRISAKSTEEEFCIITLRCSWKASKTWQKEQTKMEEKMAVVSSSTKGLLQSEELYQYILDTSVYPREAEALKELREVSSSHPRAGMGTAPDAGQLMAMLLKLTNAKKTIEVGVFTGYSLLLTALNIPEDGKILAIDVDRKAYEVGLPVIKKAGIENKIEFIESEALQGLDQLLENGENEGSFDFAFVDADKINYWNYHERLMKLLKVGGLAVYDNTLWRGTVAMQEDVVRETLKVGRKETIKFNKQLASDPRVQLCHASIGDGVAICRRLY